MARQEIALLCQRDQGTAKRCFRSWVEGLKLLIVSEFLSLKAYLFFTTEIIKILSRDGKGKRYREFVLNRLICKRADGPFGVLPGAPLFRFVNEP